MLERLNTEDWATVFRLADERNAFFPAAIVRRGLSSGDWMLRFAREDVTEVVAEDTDRDDERTDILAVLKLRRHGRYAFIEATLTEPDEYSEVSVLIDTSLDDLVRHHLDAAARDRLNLHVK